MPNKKQLIDTANLFVTLGQLPQARKIAQKLIQGHRERLATLSRIDMSDSNYVAVMRELNEMQYLTKVNK
jgi:hypothetical protein